MSFGHRVLIISSTKAGSGRAYSFVRNRVVGKLDEIGWDYEIVETEYRAHVYEIVGERIRKFGMVVAAGGDGTVHEIVNGLFGNLDIPIGVLPCGSGNALASSIHYSKLRVKPDKRDFFERMLTFLVEGRPTKLPLMRIESDRQSIFHCFLSVTWGIVADIDRESEIFRFLGASRFDIAAIWAVLVKQAYKGKLFLFGLDDCEWKCVEGKFVCVMATLLPMISSTVFADRDKLNEQRNYIHVQYLMNDTKRRELVEIGKIMAGGSNDREIKHPKLHSVKVSKFRIETKKRGRFMVDGEFKKAKRVEAELSESQIRVVM